MAALFDTTVAVLLLRRKPPEDAGGLIRAAEAEIEAGGALLPAIAVSELMVGERDPKGVRALAETLARLPSVLLPVEAAGHAGAMGAFLAARGAPIPLPDLLIAATAVWLDVPLLSWDADYARSVRRARESTSAHPGAERWRALRLHPATRGA